MSKPKRYDRVELVNRAIELFRKKGFSETSTANLVAELGVNRKSMYAEFGSKQGLFEACLDYYSSHHLSFVLAPLEVKSAELSQIKKAFHNYAAAGEGLYRGLGCLLCNTAIERASLDKASGVAVDNYLKRINSAFLSALTHARSLGQIKDTTNVPDSAEFLTTLMLGFASCVRANAPQEQLWASQRVIDNYLDSLV